MKETYRSDGKSPSADRRIESVWWGLGVGVSVAVSDVQHLGKALCLG